MANAYTKRKKILVVDDAEINRDILSSILEDYEVEEASNGIQAINILNHHFREISLILLDLIMPEMDGYEVLTRMNRYHWIEKIPVIIISSENSKFSVSRAYELGATDFLMRPFDAAQVRHRVEKVISEFEKLHAPADSRESGSYVYIVGDDYRIKFLNEDMKRRYPDVQPGEYCYSAICGESEPCPGCARGEKSGRQYSVLNKKLDMWVSVTAGAIDLPGIGAGQVMIASRLEDAYDPAVVHTMRTRTGRDHWTGLYTDTGLFLHVEERIKAEPDKQYAMVAMDIKHFKLFNEWYGRKAGDDFLLTIAGFLRELEQDLDAIAGYFGEDNFCILMPDSWDEIKSLHERIVRYAKGFDEHTGFLPFLGIYQVDDKSLSAATMYDRALIALSTTESEYGTDIRYFDTNMLKEMQDEQHMLHEIQKGMQDEEFLFYLQPKTDMRTGKIIGSEALVRWKSKENGLISPGAFIPILEKSGFVVSLDRFIWEAVCKWLRKCLDAKLPVAPVSINVSRKDIYFMDVADFLLKLMRQYRIPAHLIEVEVTESAYVEGLDDINSLVSVLQKKGIKILMDDFGSGYSSLNMLQNINIDVLKLDMKFLDAGESKRGTEVLESVVEMSRQLGLPVIAEGVETETQVKQLTAMGCYYAQGYYYYKPMPAEDFEKLLQNADNVDVKGIRLETEDHEHHDACIDPLTGAYSRHYLTHHSELDNVRAVVMMSVDGYDRICAKYGSTTGELILQNFASTVKASVREDDKLIRTEEERFLLIFRNLSSDIVSMRLEQIRNKINTLEFAECPNLRVSISAGAYLCDSCNEENIRHAYEILQEAQWRGNRVVTE